MRTIVPQIAHGISLDIFVCNDVTMFNIQKVYKIEI